MATLRQFGFWAGLALTGTLVMAWVSHPLTNEVAPSGIVSFELAGSAARAQQIIGSWSERTRTFAAFGLGLDYLYLLLYSRAIAVGCQLAAQARWSRYAWAEKAGAPIARAQYLAAACDAIENTALFSLLLGSQSDGAAQLAASAAAVKFALLALGFGYAGLSLLVPRTATTTVERRETDAGAVEE